MKNKKGWNITKCALSLFVLFNLTYISFSQKKDSTIVTGHFGGGVTVTNNGISFIPNFTLGKPAAIFDMSAGKGKLSFESQFRFALEGKPWSFVFWWRYKLLNTGLTRKVLQNWLVGNLVRDCALFFSFYRMISNLLRSDPII